MTTIEQGSVPASVATIERELARIPVGSTMRHQAPQRKGRPEVPLVATLGADIEAWRSAVPAKGSYPCARGCGERVEMPGICSSCGKADDVATIEVEFAAALASIPPSFRWAAPPELEERCGEVIGKHGRRVPLGKLARNMIDSLISGEIRTFTLRGVPDAGKTALACALIRILVDRAGPAWLAFQRSVAVGTRREAHAEPRIVTLARGARFVAARDICPPRDRGPEATAPAYVAAERATLLVLDELGQEADGSSWAAERTAETTKLLARRWDAGAATVITTPLSDDEVAKTYGGGIQKRVCRAKQVKVITIVRRQDGNR